MDVGSAFGADAEPAEAFEPGEGASDWPADLAQAGTMISADTLRRTLRIGAGRARLLVSIIRAEQSAGQKAETLLASQPEWA